MVYVSVYPAAHECMGVLSTVHECMSVPTYPPRMIAWVCLPIHRIQSHPYGHNIWRLKAKVVVVLVRWGGLGEFSFTKVLRRTVVCHHRLSQQQLGQAYPSRMRHHLWIVSRRVWVHSTIDGHIGVRA